MYRIIEDERVIDSIVSVYNCKKILKKKDDGNLKQSGEWEEEAPEKEVDDFRVNQLLQIKQIKLADFTHFTNVCYNLIMYLHYLESYEGNYSEGKNVSQIEVQLEKFIKVPEFWCRKTRSHFYVFCV